MINSILTVAVMVVLPVFVFSQKNAQKHPSEINQSSNTRNNISKLPNWAGMHNYDAKAHAYFPDYYTYYDPKRGGYIFWKDGKYTFTPSMPPFLEKVDMSKTRIKILKGLSLDMQPEQNYPHYMKMYPAQENRNNLVPVPVPGTPGN